MPRWSGRWSRSVDAVVNFAAETHVDRSILEPEAFLSTGVIGVHVLLEACRTAAARPRFLQVSHGRGLRRRRVRAGRGGRAARAAIAVRRREGRRRAAGAELRRDARRGCDRDPRREHVRPVPPPEKLIPLFITNALDDRQLPLYGDGLQRRDWLYVSDHAAAVDFVLRHGLAGETYNVAGGAERTNREVVTRLLEHLGKPWSLVREVEDRPGHDRRYAMDGSKLAALGWRPTVAFEAGLESTVDWFRANEAWWRAARSGDWDGWYERQYGRRLATGQPAPSRDA